MRYRLATGLETLIVALVGLSCARGDAPPTGQVPDEVSTRSSAVASPIIPVLDFQMPFTQAAIDDTTAPIDWKVGTVRVFTTHSGATNADGSLNYSAIVNSVTPTPASLPVAMRPRGNSSLTWPKKNYALEFRVSTTSSNEANVSLIGMSAESDWVLHSCWSDKTCMRNALAYWIGRQSMPNWTPDTRYCEVFINGQYRGLYLATEKIKKSTVRVNISKPTTSDLEQGYIVSRQAGTPDPQVSWTSPFFGTAEWPLYWEADYPKAEDLTPAMTDNLHTFFNAIETMWQDGSWANSNYLNSIDLWSWLSFTLVQELTNNTDAYWNSMYMTRRRTDPAKPAVLVMGPIWDFDMAFGNTTWWDSWRTDSWQWARNVNHRPYQTLWQRDSNFKKGLSDGWSNARSTVLPTSTVMIWVDGTFGTISQALARDELVWHRLGMPVFYEPQPFATTFTAAVAKLKTFLDSRLSWMDGQLSPGVVNLAIGKTATQSSDQAPSSGAPLAVDGNTNYNLAEGSVTHTHNDPQAWWQVDLGGSFPIDHLDVWTRRDYCDPNDRLKNFYVLVSNQPFPASAPVDIATTTAWKTFIASIPGYPNNTSCPFQLSMAVPVGAFGRYVRVQLQGTNYLSLAEVQVWRQRNPKAMADFDLDNRNDILWHNGTTGASQAWFMNGVSRTSFSDFPSSSNRTDASGWKPMALGDFEGHGQIELLWHNGATGESEIWNVSGTPTSVGFLSSSLNFADSTSWRIEGVGDFDNDGKSDILLHNGATGVTQIWFMDGVTRKLYFEVPSSLYVADSTGWRIEGLDHFNTDTVPDIFWRNVTTGAMQIWLMNRWGNRLSALDVDSSLNQPDSNGWKCQGTGDYDYDGKPDLLWHNGATGASQVWFMNGAVRKGYASLSLNVADSSGWRIVRH